MFRCELSEIIPDLKGCGSSVSRPGEKSVMVTVEQRPAEYPSRAKAQRLRVGRKTKYADDPGGAGYEIVKQVRACTRCAEDFRAMRENDEYSPIPD
ncbi:MAG: hypothetical protein R3A47_03275 [Polyangiales bacterium]